MTKLAISGLIAAFLVAGAMMSSPAPVSAQSSAEGKKPLRGVVRPMPRRGGYSYKYNQGINTRRFVDPTVSNQTVAGPFDSGFFFSSPAAPRGGDSPYMQ